MLQRLKIAPRLTLLIVLGTGVVLAAVTTADYLGSRRLLENELRARACQLAGATARDVEAVLTGVEKAVKQACVSLERYPPGLEESYAYLSETLRRHPEIYGSALVLERRPSADGRVPAAETGLDKGVDNGVDKGLDKGDARIPYVYRPGAEFASKDLGTDSYGYREFEWYALPMTLGRAVWTEPYFDAGGADALMVTLSVPIHASGGASGFTPTLMTADLTLDQIQHLLEELRPMLEERGEAFLLSAKGIFLCFAGTFPPGLATPVQRSLPELAARYGKPDMLTIGAKMLRGESGFEEVGGIVRPGKYWLAYAPVANTGWSLGTMYSQTQVTAKLFELMVQHLVLGGAAALLMVFVALAIARSLSKPIRELGNAAEVLAQGNLDAPLPAPAGKDEVAQLARSFARMRTDIKRYIDDLRETTAAKARIEQDLETARNIQLDLVPSRFHFTPPRSEIEIFALLDPAKQVGGDFYDFFLLGARRLFIAVGDVSGKGVPAAIFMAQSKAFLKAIASNGANPAQSLQLLNDELSLENEEAMFVTVFCALVDLETGELSYASGGHGAPFVQRASGGVESLPRVEGPLLGLGAGITCALGQCVLNPGDTLVSYSDGVSEALGPGDALYGDEKVADLLARHRGLDLKSILHAIREDVQRFEGERHQADDITMLAVRFLGKQKN